MLQDGLKLYEEAYYYKKQIRKDQKRLKIGGKVVPEASPFVDRTLDDKTEEEKQSYSG